MLSLVDDGVVRTEQISNIGVDITELEERYLPKSLRPFLETYSVQ
jgi:hypothetical protein